MKVRSRCCAIIVTFNGAEWIRKCISSLQDGSVKVDVVIVDNGSTDETKDFAKEFQNIHLIENKENLGFGKANNLALKYAYEEGYDSFFLLNQDAWVEEDTIYQLQKFLSKNPKFGILSPIHMNGTGGNLDAGFERYMYFRKSSGFYRDFRQNKLKKDIYEVSFVNAAAWMISRKCLSKVGLFHPLFDHYGEDDNFIHRVKDKKLKIGVLGSTRIYHDRESRFRRRIDPKVKFRSMVVMTHLDPKRSKNRFLLWLLSMKNLFMISFFWSKLPNLTFYSWGIIIYPKIVDEIRLFEETEDNVKL